ncbi:MAG: DUF397 domain-containing protein [Actinomadura sp.]
MTWRKASYSTANGGNCVEVAGVPGGRLVAARDSKHPAGPNLLFSRSDWRALIEDIKARRYDLH